MSYIIGIDIGTTNTKAVAFTDTGLVLADANAPDAVQAALQGAGTRIRGTSDVTAR